MGRWVFLTHSYYFSQFLRRKKKKKNFEQIYLENKYKELAVLFSGTPEYEDGNSQITVYRRIFSFPLHLPELMTEIDEELQTGVYLCYNYLAA